METIGNLTNDELRKKFSSQFDLVNYAIKLADNMIKTGRDPRVKVEAQNRAIQILAEITSGKDQFDELPTEPVAEAQPSGHTQRWQDIDNKKAIFSKSHGKKHLLAERDE